MTLNRDAILAADDLETREVEVPEWGGSVRVRAMTVGDQAVFLDAEKGGEADFLARFVTRVCVGEDGKRLFADEDAEALKEKSMAAVKRVWAVAAELNGLGAFSGN